MEHIKILTGKEKIKSDQLFQTNYYVYLYMGQVPEIKLTTELRGQSQTVLHRVPDLN